MKKLWFWLILMLLACKLSYAEDYIDGKSSIDIIKQQVIVIQVMSQELAQVQAQMIIVTQQVTIITQQVNVITNVISQPATNFSATSDPYTMVQTGASNDIDLAYNYQSLSTTGTAGLYIPDGLTTLSYNVTIDLIAFTNSITIGTNNVLFTTNDVLGIGASEITIKTNGNVSTLLFMKPKYMRYWRLFGI